METTSLFFFNDTATTEIYTLSLHDALPIFSTYILNSVIYSVAIVFGVCALSCMAGYALQCFLFPDVTASSSSSCSRSEEHTSELQSRQYLVCRLLLEKKKNFSFGQFDNAET